MNPDATPEPAARTGAEVPALAAAPSGPALAQTNPGTQAAVLRVVLWGLAAVSLVALLTSVFLWQKLANMQEQLARQSADAGAQSVEALLLGHDLVIDGADNFPTRYLLDAATRRLGIPLVYGAVHRFTGQISVFDPRRDDSPCYRCLFPRPPSAADAPNCSEAGVLGVMPGIIGMLQANEAIKLVLGQGRSLAGRLLCFDALDASFRELLLARDPLCPGCGSEAVFTGYEDIVSFCSDQ